jgi:hypothetical protein
MGNMGRSLAGIAGSLLFFAAVTIGLSAPAAQADPGNGCYSSLPWAICNEPWNNYPPGSWNFDPKPAQWGPHGYVPCTTPGGCNH